MISRSMANYVGVQVSKIEIWQSGYLPIFELRSHNWLLEYSQSLDGSLQQVCLKQEQGFDDFITYLEKTSSNH